MGAWNIGCALDVERTLSLMGKPRLKMVGSKSANKTMTFGECGEVYGIARRIFLQGCGITNVNSTGHQFVRSSRATHRA